MKQDHKPQWHKKTHYETIKNFYFFLILLDFLLKEYILRIRSVPIEGR